MSCERAYHPCEAPKHEPGCNGRGTTWDHFTPQCIGKILGWSKKQIDSIENQQWLSPPCHTAKDKTTPTRARMVIYQEKQDHEISLGEHQHLLEYPDNLPPLNSYHKRRSKKVRRHPHQGRSKKRI